MTSDGTFMRAVVTVLAMVAATILAMFAKPSERIADSHPRLDLETLIPIAFADWQVDSTIVPVSVAADVKARLDRLYNQTLARTYVNQRGDRIMLSIAYGSDQSDALIVHRPEVCYVSQGFQVNDLRKTTLSALDLSIPATQVVARQGPRIEPITYWATVGDQIARSRTELKLAQIKYGLTGRIPDGLLFRVSSLSSNTADAYRLQEQFVATLIAQLPPGDRVKLLGRIATGD